MNYADPTGLIGEGKIRSELDKQFSNDELSPKEKYIIAKFSSKQLGFSDMADLTKALVGNEKAKQALADKIADAVMKSGDSKLIDLYKKAKDIENKYAAEKKKNGSCKAK